MGATLHPRRGCTGIKSMIAHPQRKTAGDPWQLGGAMIVRPDGEVTYQLRSETRRRPSAAIATLLDEARKAVAA